MKTLFAVLLLATAWNIDLDKIAQANKYKTQARDAFEKRNFKEAVRNYHYLVDSLNLPSQEVFLNLAHSYYHLEDSENALKYYADAAAGADKLLSSAAHHQIGILHAKAQQFEDALGAFKQALLSNPANEEARHNYELIKKKLQEQKEQEQENKEDDKQDQDQEKDQQQDQSQQQDNQDSQGQQDQEQENQDSKQEEQQQDQQQKQENQQEGKEGEQQEKDQQQEQQEQDSEEASKDEQERQAQQMKQQRMEEINMSEDKARMILEALRNDEIQYYQQLKKKSEKKPESGKPDW